MVDDARSRTKVFLDTYLTAANMKEDDGATNATFLVAYGLPDYPLVRVFIDKSVDIVFSVGQPNSEALIDSDHYPIGYEEHVPITIYVTNKTGFTAVKRIWTAEAELRRICEANPTGSLRRITGTTPKTERLGGTWFWSMEYSLDYVRDLT